MQFFAKAVALDPRNREAAALFAAVQKGATAPPASASASSSGSRAAGGGAANAAGPSGDEQTVIKRIMAARTYYEMLGVEKGFSEGDLKKAYRKTSLRVHPDKNSAAGAVQAFQRVTEAFDVLSDARKKEIYDQVGHEQFTERVRANGSAGAEAPAGFPFGGGAGAQHVSAEDIFNMFFQQAGGAGFQFNGQRVHQFRRGGFGGGNNGGRGGGRGGEARGGQGQGGTSWWTFLPVLFVIFFWLSNTVLSSSPAFALVQSAHYPVQRTTMSTERLEYFVERRFEQQYPTRQDVVRVEREVRGEWLRVLESRCIYERRERSSQVFWMYGEKRRELEAQPLPNCDRYFRVKQDMVTG